MWPFGRKGVATRLSGLEEATEVELVTSIVSANVVKSPLSGVRAVILRIEIFDGPDTLGEIILGDIVSLRDRDGVELSVAARRLKFRFPEARTAAVELEKVPPELIDMLRRAPGQGPITYREDAFREGDAVRIQAFVAPSAHSGAQGYRSLPRIAFMARDDLAPVFVMREK